MSTKNQPHDSSLPLDADGPNLLLHIGAAHGALLELGGADEAAAVVAAGHQRAVHLSLEADLRTTIEANRPPPKKEKKSRMRRD